MSSEKRDGKFISQRTLIFNASMPPAIEPPSVADLKSKPRIPFPAEPRATGPR
jgi:hypothetical protein